MHPCDRPYTSGEGRVIQVRGGGEVSIVNIILLGGGRGGGGGGGVQICS